MIRDYLSDLVAAASGVLGPDLVGAYAAGSVAMDAYEPGRSDVDVALVCSSVLPVEAKSALVAALRHESLPGPARGLELVVYRADVAAAGAPEPGFELELNTGREMEFRATFHPSDRPAADGLFWYGLDRSILHQCGLALVGPPASEVFADLAPDAVRQLLAEALEWWIARPAPAAGTDAVLGACRSLAKVRDGVWLSKVAAAERLAADDEVVAAALAARRGAGPPPAAEAARAFQRRVLAEVRL